MFRTFFTAATLAALVASNLLAAQDDPSQKDREEQTLEDAIERATIRIRERVNVVGTDKALETIPGAAYALEGEELFGRHPSRPASSRAGSWQDQEKNRRSRTPSSGPRSASASG